MLIEALKPLKVRVNDHEILLDPGQPCELPDDAARRLLAKVPDKVRRVEPMSAVIELAVRPDGTPFSGVYWEDGLGRIVGPATPEFVIWADGAAWIVTTCEGHGRWVRADRLRSRAAFEVQQPLQVVEPIRELGARPTKPRERRSV